MQPVRRALVWGALLVLLFLGTTDATTYNEDDEPDWHMVQERLSATFGVDVLIQGDLDAASGAITAAVQHQFVPSIANHQRTIARQASVWPQHHTFLSAVAADSRVSCSHVLTDRQGREGAALYFVVGDATGWLYFFTPDGHLLHEYNTGVNSSVTALSSELVRHNQTFLLVGLHDGTVMVLDVAHEHARSRDGSGISSIHMISTCTAADRALQLNDSTTDGHQQPIRHLLFGMSASRRMMVAVDASSRVLLMTMSTGRVLTMQQLDSGSPLAVNLNSNMQLVVQTESAAGIVLMKRGRSRVVRRCSGLDQPDQAGPDSGLTSQAGQPGILVAAVFDPQRSFRVFGITQGGELVALTVPAGVAAHQCRVVQSIPLGLPRGPVHLVMSRGRLVLLHSDGVAVFNASSPRVRLLGSHFVSHTWKQLWQLYGLSKQHQQLLLQGDAAASESGSSDGGTSSSSGSTGSGGDGTSCETLLHSSAIDSSLAAAAATSSVLLLPFSSRGVAVFGIGATPGGFGGGGGGGQAGSLGRGVGSGVNWPKMVQPFVIIMMIIVGVWQFMRASNRNSLSRMRAAQYGAGMGDMAGFTSRIPGMQGLEGVSPEDLGRLGLLGDFGSLDSDFGPYAGPRGRRDREQLSGHGGLSALNARRRARAAMFSNRQAERGRALGTTLGGSRGPVVAGLTRSQGAFGRGVADSLEDDEYAGVADAAMRRGQLPGRMSASGGSQRRVQFEVPSELGDELQEASSQQQDSDMDGLPQQDASSRVADAAQQQLSASSRSTAAADGAGGTAGVAAAGRSNSLGDLEVPHSLHASTVGAVSGPDVDAATAAFALQVAEAVGHVGSPLEAARGLMLGDCQQRVGMGVDEHKSLPYGASPAGVASCKVFSGTTLTLY